MVKENNILPSNLAPIVLFIYNRPQHTRRTLQALKNNHYADRSVLYVFADGAKENANEQDSINVELTRDVVVEQQWCKDVILIKREKNLNLSNNIINGVTEVINKHGKAIVLEDDIVTSPYFLQYCNDGLDVYENAKQVFSINGFMFPIDFESEATTFLSPVATSSWGWATWADRWQHFVMHPEYTMEIASNPLLCKRFNIGSLNFLSMLQHINTWDLRWYYTAFIRNALGLFPTESLVENAGFDGSGTHKGNENLDQRLYNSIIEVKLHDSIDIPKYSKMVDYFTNDATPTPISQKIKNKLKGLLRF